MLFRVRFSCFNAWIVCNYITKNNSSVNTSVVVNPAEVCCVCLRVKNFQNSFLGKLHLKTFHYPQLWSWPTVPLKCKLTGSQSSILETRFSILDSRKLRGSRLESSFETFEAVREFIETVRELIESSFETFEWEKQRTFRAINFWHVWIFLYRQIYFEFRSLTLINFSPNLLITKFVTEFFFI